MVGVMQALCKVVYCNLVERAESSQSKKGPATCQGGVAPNINLPI